MLEQEELSCISLCCGTRVELHAELWVRDPVLQQIEVTNCCFGNWGFSFVFHPTQVDEAGKTSEKIVDLMGLQT
eukprot:4944738-Prorocentrum_lima.AAC.1